MGCSKNLWSGKKAVSEVQCFSESRAYFRTIIGDGWITMKVGHIVTVAINWMTNFMGNYRLGDAVWLVVCTLV